MTFRVRGFIRALTARFIALLTSLAIIEKPVILSKRSESKEPGFSRRHPRSLGFVRDDVSRALYSGTELGLRVFANA